MHLSRLEWLQRNCIPRWKSRLCLWFQPKVMPILAVAFPGKNKDRRKFCNLSPLISGKWSWWVAWRGCSREGMSVLASSTLGRELHPAFEKKKLPSKAFVFKSTCSCKNNRNLMKQNFPTHPPQTLFYWIVSTCALHWGLRRFSPLCLCLCNPRSPSTAKDKFADKFPADLQAVFISNSTNSLTCSSA